MATPPCAFKKLGEIDKRLEAFESAPRDTPREIEKTIALCRQIDKSEVTERQRTNGSDWKFVFLQLNQLVGISILRMIKEIIFVGAGSFLGGAVRYLVGAALKETSDSFPWNTFCINILGSLLLGIFWSVLNRNSLPTSPWTLFLTVGFCGGFTTFSTFSKEGFLLLQAGHYFSFFCYTIGSVLLGIFAVAFGFMLAK